MKPIFVGFVLMVLICAVGIVCAEPMPAPTLVASGTVEGDTIGLTLPSNPTLSLTRGSANIQGCGYAVVTQTGSTHNWELSVTGSDGGYMVTGTTPTRLSSPLYISMIEADPITWVSLTTTPAAVTSDTYPSNIANIPLYLKQPVSISDVGGGTTQSY